MNVSMKTLRQLTAAVCSAVIALSAPFTTASAAFSAVRTDAVTAPVQYEQNVSGNISTDIGLVANLFCISDTGIADHGQLQWATTLQASSYTLYRSTAPSTGFVPIYEGTGSSFEDDDMIIGNTYYYQLKVSGSKGEWYSGVRSLEPCTAPSGLNTYDNQKGSSLVYETSGYKVGDTYYSYSLKSHSGTNDIYLAESTSNDGKHFGNERNVADQSQNSALSSCKIESVHIDYIPRVNKVVVWAHWEKPSGYSDGKALVITGTPGGQFTVHHVYNPLDIQVRDMAIFFDDDGTGYLIAAANKEGQGANATIYIFQMNSEYSDVTKVVKTLHEDQYREFPNLIKKDGYYFLFTSQAAGWYPSSGAYTVTKDIAGEWSELRSIGNSSTFSSQSGWIVNMQDRNYLMHAYRWLKGSGTSGTTLCPLYFDNGFAFYDYCPYFRYNTSTGDLFPVQKGELLSQDKPASASLAASTTNYASHAFDGSYQTSFTANGDHKKWPFYLETDLGEICELANIQISWYICKGSEGYYTYTVDGSTDGEHWTTLLDRTDKNDETITKTYGFNSDMLSGKARYVRLNVKNATLQNNPNNNWYNPTVYEVKIYGRKTGSNDEPSPPAVTYNFDSTNGTHVPSTTGSGSDLILNGEAKVISDAQAGNVLYLSGADDTYAELPAGLLDGCTAYTVEMKVKSDSEGNFFTFAVGRDKEKYAFFRVARDLFRFATTLDTWRGESEMKCDADGTNWHTYRFVVNGGQADLFIDGTKTMSSPYITTLLSDMGSGLTAYIGKSYYPDDTCFRGWIDDVSIYRYASYPENDTAPAAAEGDVNGDGHCTVADAVMLQSFLLCSGKLTVPEAADLNGDRRINAFDMVLMRKILTA